MMFFSRLKQEGCDDAAAQTELEHLHSFEDLNSVAIYLGKAVAPHI